MSSDRLLASRLYNLLLRWFTDHRPTPGWTSQVYTCHLSPIPAERSKCDPLPLRRLHRTNHIPERAKTTHSCFYTRGEEARQLRCEQFITYIATQKLMAMHMQNHATSTEHESEKRHCREKPRSKVHVATYIFWREAMGRQKLRNHFGTAAVLGRSQFVLKQLVLLMLLLSTPGNGYLDPLKRTDKPQHTYIHIYIYVYTQIYIYIYVRIQSACMYVYIYILV